VSGRRSREWRFTKKLRKNLTEILAKKEELEGKDARNDQGQQDVANNMGMKADDLQTRRKRSGTVAAAEITDRDSVAAFRAGF